MMHFFDLLLKLNGNCENYIRQLSMKRFVLFISHYVKFKPYVIAGFSSVNSGKGAILISTWPNYQQCVYLVLRP